MSAKNQKGSKAPFIFGLDIGYSNVKGAFVLAPTEK